MVGNRSDDSDILALRMLLYCSSLCIIRASEQTQHHRLLPFSSGTSDLYAQICSPLQLDNQHRAGIHDCPIESQYAICTPEVPPQSASWIWRASSLGRVVSITSTRFDLGFAHTPRKTLFAHLEGLRVYLYVKRLLMGNSNYELFALDFSTM